MKQNWYKKIMMTKKQRFKDWLYSTQRCSVYTGKGFIQGLGFDLEVKKTCLLGFNFVTDIRFDVKGEWMRDLKKRWKEDDEQQQLEKIHNKHK